MSGLERLQRLPKRNTENTKLKNPNGCVLDPFMGSGTTGVSAIKNGRRFIGIEKEERYFDISLPRIKETESFI